MSLTIVELIWGLEPEGQILRLVMTDQSMLFPEPAMKSGHQWLPSGKEKRNIRFP